MIVEMIRIRSSLQSLRDVMPLLQEQVREINEDVIGVDIHIVNQARNEGDLAVFIVWDRDGTEGKSKEGFMIAEMLQEIGIMNHEIWTDDLLKHGGMEEMEKEG